MLKKGLGFILRLVLKTPLFLAFAFSRFFPRQKNLLLFGGWKGKDYRGNSRYLFEYINQHHPEYVAFWITRNVEVEKRVRSLGYKVCLAQSPMGCWLTLRARFILVTHGYGDVVSSLAAGALMLNLTHYTFSIKQLIFSLPDSLFERLRLYLYDPFGYLFKADYYVVASPQTAFTVTEAHGIAPEKVLPLGLPKTDHLRGLCKQPRRDRVGGYDFTDCKRVFFLPTWRQDTDFSIFDCGFDAEAVNAQLKAMNCKLLINFHRATEESQKRFNLSHIISSKLKENESNDFLPSVDVLITDYSSIFADYLVVDRPLIFAKFDHAGYLKESPLNLDYDSLPGPKVLNWTELMAQLELILVKGEDAYVKERRKMHDFIYQHRDGQSKQRIVNWLKQQE